MFRLCHSFLLMALLSQSVLMAQRTDPPIDFNKPFDNTYTWTFGEYKEVESPIEAIGIGIVRDHQEKGIVGQFFRLPNQQWLLVDYRKPDVLSGAIYASKKREKTEEESKNNRYLKPPYSLEKLRDWPLAQDQANAEAPKYVFPGAPQDSIKRYYVNGKLAAAVYYKEHKPQDDFFRRNFIHKGKQFLLPYLQFIPSEEGFYVFKFRQHLHLEGRGAYQKTKIPNKENTYGLVPTGFWDGQHILDSSWSKDAPDYFMTKGFFKEGRREGWTLVLTGEGEKTWLTYFSAHQPIVSFEGTFNSFTDTSGTKYDPYTTVSVKDGERATPNPPQEHLINYFQRDWVLGQQLIPTDFDGFEKKWLLWESESTLDEQIKEEAVVKLQLQAGGKLIYTNIAKPKRQQVGSWELNAILPTDAETVYSTPFPYMVLKLVWKDGSSASYVLDRLFSGLVILSEEG